MSFDWTKEELLRELKEREEAGEPKEVTFDFVWSVVERAYKERDQLVGATEAERLRAEVERLRDTVAFLRACVPPTRPTDYGHEVWTAALRAEAATERVAVVAYLREEGSINSMLSVLKGAANDIERGEHRREETK